MPVCSKPNLIFNAPSPPYNHLAPLLTKEGAGGGLGRVFCALFCIAFLGGGCFPQITTRQIAAPLELRPTQAPVSKTQGFGKLPIPNSPLKTATVTLAVPVPPISQQVTVIRQRRGTPNDTEFRNLTNALGISDGFIGLHGNVHELTLAWNDEKRYRWSYRGSERLLEFSSEQPSSQPIILTAPPAQESIFRTATTFLLERGIRPITYRDPIVDSSKFPAKLLIAFPAFADERDVVQADGTAHHDAELLIDAAQNAVVAGRIFLTAKESDRSDYSAITTEQTTTLLLQGGISPVSGNLIITSYASVLLRVVDQRTNETYLIPSLLAKGVRAVTDNTLEPTRIVVPLVAP